MRPKDGGFGGAQSRVNTTLPMPRLPKESITTGTTADLNVPSCASGLSPLWLGLVAAEKRLSCLEQVSAEEGLAVPGDTLVCCLLFSLHACRPAEEMII